MPTKIGRTLGGLILAVSLLAISIPVQASTPQIAGGFLAVTTGSGTSQISSFHLDGSGGKQLTKGPANHYGPSVSPNGKQVLFTGEDNGGYAVYRMNIDGTGIIPVTKLSVGAGAASWSPDGKTVIYAALAPGNNFYQIFLAASDGSNPVQLTHTTGNANVFPVFSPDGKYIAYVSAIGSTTKIWLMHADSTGAKALSSGTYDNYPAWVNNNSLLFARSDSSGKTSVIESLSLTGVEKPQSPTDVFITEPQPLPDGKSYGATFVTGQHFGLIKVSRANGSAIAQVLDPASKTFFLAASTDNGFTLTPIQLPATSGDSFTISWILTNAPAAPSGSGGPSIPWLPILVLIVLIGIAAAYMILKPKDPCKEFKDEVERWKTRLERDLAMTAPTGQEQTLADSIANDRTALAEAEVKLARCLGIQAPGEGSGGSVPPVAVVKPIEVPKPPVVTPPPPVDPPQPVAPPVEPPNTVSPPPVVPKPPRKRKPKIPPKTDPCGDGPTSKTDIACSCEVELFILSKAKIEIEGAYAAGEEDIDKAISGLETSLSVAGIGVGLIGAVTDPVGSILGTLGVPSVDDATGKATDAAVDGLKDLGEKLKGLRKFGWMQVTCPKQKVRFSCVITSECQDGAWVVTDKSLKMEKLGKATPVTMSNAPHVAGVSEMAHAAQVIVNWASNYNAAAARKMRECEKACQ